MRSERQADVMRAVSRSLPYLLLGVPGAGVRVPAVRTRDRGTGVGAGALGAWQRVLEAVRDDAEADRAFCVGADGLELFVASYPAAGGVHTRASVLARTLDWGILQRVSAGQVVRLEDADLRRSPRFRTWRRERVEARLVLCATAEPGELDGGERRPLMLGLWLEAGRDVSDDHAREATALLAGLRGVERAGRERVGAQPWLALGRTAAHLAHDLRHLLTLSDLTLERARIEGRADDALAGELGQLLRAASDLCAGALTTARDGNEHAADSTDPECPLLPLLHEAARHASAISGRGDVRIRVRCHDELAVRGSRTELLRIFVNLALNAFEVTRPGGVVRLEGRASSGVTYVRVVDEGAGLVGSERRRLVDGTEPAPGSVLRSGRGFGLASVRSVLTELGGTISAEDTGRGTSLVVKLPGALALGQGHGAWVLVVDADAERSRAIESRLGEHGHDTICVSRPCEALRILREVATQPVAIAVAQGTVGAGLGRLVRLAARAAVPCVVAEGVDPNACASDVLAYSARRIRTQSTT